MWSDYVSTLKELSTGISKILSGIDVWTLLKDPWVIVLMAISCIILVVRRMDRGLVTFLSIPAFLVLFQKTSQNFTVPNCYVEKLPIFVCGSLAIAAINVYFHLVRD